EEEDEFGSFDDASFEASFDEFNELEETSPETLKFDEEIFQNPQEFDKKLEMIMDQTFSNTPHDQGKKEDQQLLDERSKQIFEELSNIPHLQPPNWIKLKIRHNLLIKLGVPINLDELNAKEEQSRLQVKQHTRKKSINEDDINWQDFNIIDYKDLQLSTEVKNEIISNTNETLSRFENEILNHSTKQYLQNTNLDIIDDKLNEMNQIYDELIKISSVWLNQLAESKSNFEVYESVVQNLIGYSQRLKREEILQDLNKVKSKSKSKRKSFW
ncbi:hypothetical protein HYPBUDRAFT_95491, partial [Hyphopichia burtonii NRRL Y-1933]